MSFNLIDEPWILVQHEEGPRELSLTQVFKEAAQIHGLSGEVPTMGFATLRLLLAICHDAIGWHSADAFTELKDDGLDLNPIVGYLEEWRHRFDLFHPERPFMQVADLRTAKDEHSGLEKLIADVPNGAQFFTTRAGRGLEEISAAEAARWLVNVQAYDPSGIRSGAVGDPLVKNGRGYPIGTAWCGQLGGVVIHGRDLRETLQFNLTQTSGGEADRPCWTTAEAQTAVRLGEAIPAGVVQVLTWQSRRVRLVGDRTGVTGLVLAQGDRLYPQNMFDLEHMSGWRYSKPQSKKFGRTVYMPNEHEPGRALWRGLPAIIAPDSRTVEDRGGEFASHLQPRTLQSLSDEVDTFVLQSIGMAYGPQSATTEEIIDDRLELHASLLTEDAVEVRALTEDAVSNADRCVRLLGQLAANLARAAGEKGDSAGEGARQRVVAEAWAGLDQSARRWVGELTVDSDIVETKRKWQATVDQLVRHLGDRQVGQAGPAAMRGRSTSFGFVSAPLAQSWFLRDLRKELSLIYPSAKEAKSA